MKSMSIDAYMHYRFAIDAGIATLEKRLKRRERKGMSNEDDVMKIMEWNSRTK